MDGYLVNIRNLIRKNEESLLKKIENNTISDRLAKKYKSEIDELNDFEQN